jgi:phage terminase small subunit
LPAHHAHRLVLSADGKGEWRRVVPLLIERRILTDADLESYCVAIGSMREARTKITVTPRSN